MKPLVLLVLLVLLAVQAAGQTTPAGPPCRCHPCKQIPLGQHSGTYTLVEDSGTGRCGSACLYSKDTDNSKYCMCEPGDLEVDVCELPGWQQCWTDEPFPCRHRAASPSVPTSVHRLRPGDIQVVAGLGDSVMAGLGAAAASMASIMTEYRDLSFAAGGRGDWRTFLTLPNILKQFNPKLKGAAYGTTVFNQQNSGFNGFNLAVSNTSAQDLPDQARALVDFMRSDNTVDLNNDWKMVTILTGARDICWTACNAGSSAEGYVDHVKRALDILQAGLPRTFVSLMTIADVTMLMDIQDKSMHCQHIHFISCPCLFNPAFSSFTRLMAQDFIRSYQTGLEDLVASGRYHTRDDFTVEVQPAATSPTSPGLDLLSPDCFHPLQKTSAALARALWNNLLEPDGAKTAPLLVRSYQEVGIRPGPFLCPSPERPFLATSRAQDNGNMATLAQDWQDLVGQRGTCPL